MSEEIQEEDWKDATVDQGMMRDIQSVLDEAYPKGLTKSGITDDWDRRKYSSRVIDALLEVLLGMDKIESAVPDDRHDANTYYRLKK